MARILDGPGRTPARRSGALLYVLVSAAVAAGVGWLAGSAHLAGRGEPATSRGAAPLVAAATDATPRAAGEASQASSVLIDSPGAIPIYEFPTAALEGSDTVAGDGFGWSVSVSGDTAVVGAFLHDDGAGRAYVFVRTAGRWRQTAELAGSDTTAGDRFGFSVAISGGTIVVGANGADDGSGRAYVFAERASGWSQQAELAGSGGAPAGDFGTSVAVSGTTIVVGADGENGSDGRSYVFDGSSGTWTRSAVLSGSLPDGYFGGSVAVSGDEILVGGMYHSYLFTRAGSHIEQTAELTSGTGTRSVAISGNLAVVGEPDSTDGAGAIEVFSRTGSGWRLRAQLSDASAAPPSAASGDSQLFGDSVALSGPVVAAGVPIGVTGSAYLLPRVLSDPATVVEPTSPSVLDGEFGSAVAVSGSSLLVGSTGNTTSAGRVEVFAVS